MRTIILFSLAASLAFGQCGKMVVNPTTGKMDCTGPAASSSARTIEWPVAKCQAGAAVTGFNLPSSSAPTAVCDATDSKPVLTFSATGQTTDPESVILPSSLTSIAFTWPVRASSSSSNTSGSATGQIAYTCVAVDGTGTSVPTLSTTASATATWSSAAGNLVKPMAFTLSTTGCAGKRLYWQFSITAFSTFTSIQALNTAYMVVTP